MDVAPEDRRVGVVYQDGALFPFMSVLANVAYGVRADRRTRERKAHAGARALRHPELASARSSSLSGGERQRVALARAVASDPEYPPARRAALRTRRRDPGGRRHRARAATARSWGFRPFSSRTTSPTSSGSPTGWRCSRKGASCNRERRTSSSTPPSSAFVASLAGVNYFVGTASRRAHVTHVVGDGWDSPIRSADDIEGRVGVVVYPWDVSLSRSRWTGRPSTRSRDPSGASRSWTIGLESARTRSRRSWRR